MRSATLMLWWPPPIGVAVGPFRPTRVDFERGEDIVGNQLSLFGEGAHAGFDALPFDRDAGGVNGANGRVGHFGSDAVAGDERDLMGHHSYYKSWG